MLVYPGPDVGEDLLLLQVKVGRMVAPFVNDEFLVFATQISKEAIDVLYGSEVIHASIEQYGSLSSSIMVVASSIDILQKKHSA